MGVGRAYTPDLTRNIDDASDITISHLAMSIQ